MKKFLIIVGIAGAHFVVTRMVDLLMRGLAAAGAYQNIPPISLKAFTLVSTVLYFPVITLALYPRYLFPGNWILIPIAVNSLLWALIIWAVWALVRNRIWK